MAMTYLVPADVAKFTESGSFFEGWNFGQPLANCVFFDDFVRFNANEWTITETDAAATEELTTGENGILLVTNTAADNDLVSMQACATAGLPFRPEVGRKLWFACKFAVSEATQVDWLVGLLETDTTPFTTSNGIFFTKPDGSTEVNFFAINSGATSGLGSTFTFTANTWWEVAFIVNSLNSVEIWVNGNVVGTITTNIPTSSLRPTIAIQNGDANSRLLLVDYILAAQTR